MCYETNYEAIEHATKPLIQQYADNVGITCISRDCKYNWQMGNGCYLKVVNLRKGICRYYEKGENRLQDRQDIPRDKMFYSPDDK